MTKPCPLAVNNVALLVPTFISGQFAFSATHGKVRDGVVASHTRVCANQTFGWVHTQYGVWWCMAALLNGLVLAPTVCATLGTIGLDTVFVYETMQQSLSGRRFSKVLLRNTTDFLKQTNRRVIFILRNKLPSAVH